MRLRNKPWAKDKIAENPQYVVPNPAEYKGNWKEVFGNENPLHIEVGTGKGQFLVGMAKQNPHINYIGIEMYESVILSALERLIEEELPNLKLLNVDANHTRLKEVASRHSNFSLQTGQYDVFGAYNKPRVLYVSLRPNDKLMNLQRDIQAVWDELSALYEKRPYRPHITIAKKWGGEAGLLEEQLKQTPDRKSVV